MFNRHNQFAGTDAQKIEDIQAGIDNNEVKAIWSSRGGYGSARIIDQLNLSNIKEQKWFVGYSDFTVFHSHIHRHLGMPTLHATMPVNVKTGEEYACKTMIEALRGEELKYNFNKHELNREGDANGVLVGGNLSILYSLCGSDSDISTEGKILFLEDLDEYLYHVDRMMMNLKRTNKLSKLAALVVGGMSDMNDNAIPYGKTAEEIILEHTREYNYPIYFGLEAGHIERNAALRLGMECKINDNSLILPS
jgi:muramoyltetrapeptide carboxypeptidase